MKSLSEIFGHLSGQDHHRADLRISGASMNSRPAAVEGTGNPVGASDPNPKLPTGSFSFNRAAKSSGKNEENSPHLPHGQLPFEPLATWHDDLFFILPILAVALEVHILQSIGAQTMPMIVIPFCTIALSAALWLCRIGESK